MDGCDDVESMKGSKKRRREAKLKKDGNAGRMMTEKDGDLGGCQSNCRLSGMTLGPRRSDELWKSQLHHLGESD